ncbi:MAG: hypothetical protein KIS73_19820 [Enhydrobacter sp.]|nr:hypothetical protein [Enhydrobacter sp.]
MSVQRSFLVMLADTISNFDRVSASPVTALAQLRRDKDVVRGEIHRLLDRYATRHGIPPEEARRLARSYIEDLLGDLFVDREEELDRAIDSMPAH